MATFKTTREIAEALNQLDALEGFAPRLLRPSRWWEHRVTMRDRLELVRVLAVARDRLSSLCERTYPELAGHAYEVGRVQIECLSLPDAPPHEPA